MELIFADLALKRKIPQNAAVLGDPQKLIPQNIVLVICKEVFHAQILRIRIKEHLYSRSAKPDRQRFGKK